LKNNKIQLGKNKGKAEYFHEYEQFLFDQLTRVGKQTKKDDKIRIDSGNNKLI
jgi:hypothetical protein